MEYVEANDAYYLKRNLWAYEARNGLLNGDKRVAQRWLSNYFVNNSSLEAPYKVYQNLTTARAYIVLGKHNEAFNVLHAVKKMARSFNRPLDAAEADVLISVINWTSGKKKEAADTLYSLLLSLRPYGFIRVAADVGKAVLPILFAIINKPAREPDKDEQTQRFIKEVYLAAYEQSKRFKGIAGAAEHKAVKLLSKQQAMILGLLSKGYKNAQIVEIAGISLNTVRYHTKIVYKKLEATNAQDAIVKAKQLGLLR